MSDSLTQKHDFSGEFHLATTKTNYRQMKRLWILLCLTVLSFTNFHFKYWSRIQAGYTIKREEGPEISNHSGVIQYQITF